jgi:hypothetical protein
MSTITHLPSRQTESDRDGQRIERSVHRSRLWLLVLQVPITWLVSQTEDPLIRATLTTILVECLMLAASNFTHSPLIFIWRAVGLRMSQTWGWAMAQLPAQKHPRPEALPPRDVPSPAELESSLRKLLVVLRDEMEAEGLPPLQEMKLADLCLELLDLHWPQEAVHALEAVFGWPRMAVLSAEGKLLKLMNRVPDGQLIDAKGTFRATELSAYLGEERWRIEQPRGRRYAYPTDLDTCDYIAALLTWLPDDPFGPHRHAIDAWFSGGAANDPSFAGR